MKRDSTAQPSHMTPRPTASSTPHPLALQHLPVVSPRAVCVGVLIALAGWGANAQTPSIIDPAGIMMQDHLKRIEQAAPPATVAPSAPLAPPEPTAPATKGRVGVVEIQFSPSELLSTQELRQLGEKYVGRSLGSADIQALLEEISTLYRNRGILTAVPVLPQQDLRSGVMRILLVEGRLGQVKVRQPWVANPLWVQDWFDLLPNVVVTADALQSKLQRFNQVSDFSATAEFTAGDRFGFSDLEIDIAATERVQPWAFYETSSAGKSTTPDQWAAGLRVSPATSMGGRVDAAVLHTDTGDTLTGSVSLPLTYKGWRTGLTGSAAESKTVLPSQEVGKQDLTILGTSQSLNWDLGRTWILQDPWILGTAISLGRQESRTQLDDGLDLFRHTVKRVSLVGTLQHESIRNRFLLRATLTGAREHAGNNDRQVSYRFWELNGNWTSVIDSDGKWYLRTSGVFRGQPSGSLGSIDRFQLGGTDTVRGFNAGASSGDQGAALQLEVRYRLPEWQSINAETYAFIDGGYTKADGVQKDLNSAGLGIQTKLNTHLGIDLMLTHQLTEPLGSRNRATLRAVVSW